MKIVHVPAPVLSQPVRQVPLPKAKMSSGGLSQQVNKVSPVPTGVDMVSDGTLQGSAGVNMPSSGLPQGSDGIDRRLQKIINDMIEALESAHDPEGVGLAANQVGLPLAIFVMRPKKTDEVTVFINPKVLKLENDPPHSKKRLAKDVRKSSEKNLEGCLSIPKIWGEVDRADRVLLSYVDSRGQHQEKWFEGFEALIIQHEMDHLNGILFTQRALEQGYKLVKEVGHGEFERYEI